ncbi:solute carrier family 46 member 3 [Chanos chanos]|uniref:Solute carrier family 46 member 3 n=1 Tax=Chanos chanos TaxID=29144 RepID=A0A6J2WXD2_CHACN|nr:solute carrier family 46 member 3-like [Chanos chanos]
MKKLYFVEPIIAVYAFASFIVYPLVQQYVYRRLWQELTNTSYPITDNSSRCAPNSSNHSTYHEEVQRAASLFSMYTELFSMIPSLIVTLFLVAYSDHRGRKITIVLPLLGSVVYTVSFLAISFFELNLYLLIVATFVSSLFGGLGTILGGCFSYVADLCEDGKQKTLRMAGVDMVIGLLSGVASISTGYFLRAAGFNWPIFTSALFHCINVLYAVFFLEESRVIDRSNEDAPRGMALRKLVSGICRLFVAGTPKRNWLLGLLLITFTSFCFAGSGGSAVVTLYELNEPLCWSEILIGYGSALSTTVFITSFFGVALFSRCLPDLVIVLIGMLSVMTGALMTAFAKTTLMMFLVRVPALLAVMPYPVMRSLMSRVVSKSEQGALFACVAFLENLSGSVAYTVFSRIYAATVAWCPGFVFLLGAGLCVIPLSLLGVVSLFRLEDSKESEPLMSEEDSAAVEDNPVA